MSSFLAFIKLIRLPNLLIIVLTQYAIRYGLIYAIITNMTDTEVVNFLLSELNFFLLSLSTVLIAAAGYIINDYFDVKIDRVNNPKEVLIGKHIKRRVAMGAHIVINFLAIFIAIYVAYTMGMIKLAAIQVLVVGALWYYSVSFKKQLLTGNIVVASLAALVPFVAGLYEMLLQYQNIDITIAKLLPFYENMLDANDIRILIHQNFSIIMKWVLGFTLFAFLSTMIREIIKDIEDYEGDRKFYSRTLPIIYGINTAKKVCQFIIVVMMVFLAYLQYKQLLMGDTFSLFYFLVLVQFPLGYLFIKIKNATKKEDYTFISKIMKLIMLFGIVYLAIFNYVITSF
ncbi:MAG: geranylgeranylglycerol-phosphate geranylgeranyltransferase [Vicingaceae bacterium]|nr:geranylgeranylglycerol-phosphate geranylgeranyltransferase [Vicingaceae bacterium]